MALGFTSHFTKSEQPFGSLILSNSDTETAGSVAYNDNNSFGICFVSGGLNYDLCDFSVSVDIDYTQYANSICSGSTETAGSVAYGDCGISTASSVSCGAPSVSCGSYSNTFTC